MAVDIDASGQTAITDLEIEVFESRHNCPGIRLGGGCQKCAMVARIKQQKHLLMLNDMQKSALQKQIDKLTAFINAARLTFKGA